MESQHFISISTFLKEINWEKHSEQFSWSQQPHSSPLPTKTRAKNLQIWLSFHLSKISGPFCPQETSANSLWQWRWLVNLQWFSWMNLAQAAAPWAKIGEEKRRKEQRLKWNVCENMCRTQPVFELCREIVRSLTIFHWLVWFPRQVWILLLDVLCGAWFRTMVHWCSPHSLYC